MASPAATETALRVRPAELLARLIRFDTTNPPGAEGACLAFCEELVRAAGCEARMFAREPARPNLVARLRGAGKAPPLLLQGHVDVVTTAGQDWTHPPFEGVIEDGHVWGRGALDMKGGVAMMLAAFLRAAADPEPPPGDVILCLMSDEEAGGEAGARFLVEEHPSLFEGVRHAIGEFGGFSLAIAGRRFYPIMVAEKRMCWMRATVHGPGGHGALPARGGTMARLASILAALDGNRLPVHITPPTRMMVEAIAAGVPAPARAILKTLLVPALADRTLGLLGDRGATFDPLIHNTVNATVLSAGEKVNVVPSTATLELDGRLLPGQSHEDLVRELRDLWGGADVEIDVGRTDPDVRAEPDMALFPTLADVLREADPEARPVPMLLPGVTDGRFFARLGIQTYGFLPMPLPEELDFSRLIHSADERIPVDAVEFGTAAVRQVLRRFGAVG